MSVTELQENERNHDNDTAHAGDGSDNTTSATPARDTDVGHAFHLQALEVSWQPTPRNNNLCMSKKPVFSQDFIGEISHQNRLSREQLIKHHKSRVESLLNYLLFPPRPVQGSD